MRETKTAYPLLVSPARVEPQVLARPSFELTDTTWKTLPLTNVLKDARQHTIEAPAGMVRGQIALPTNFKEANTQS